jgi:signal transduction histidine kinase/CheY-like chemotaxis protein/HPt (histidine-containing phosphotransfer) domain-containing protein
VGDTMDIVLESVRSVVLIGGLLYFIRTSKMHPSLYRDGGNLILAGLVLLVAGSCLDVTDNFDALNQFVVIGDTPTQAFLEKAIGSLGGFILLAIGMMRWIRSLIQAEEGKQRVSFLESEVVERKKAEEALQNVIERANKLALQAQIADTSKSEFLANMSHEIRTPMNGVIGMTTLLLDTPLNEEQRQYAETIRASGAALLSLINDILDFSKIEAGHLELEKVHFNLRDTFAEFLDLMALRAQEKGIELIGHIAPETPCALRGDPGRLRQILINLAGNALKFTEAGEVVVSVALESKRDSQALLRFSVRDTGMGIPEERQSMLFDAFTQLDASTTRKFGGTGLGLAISKRLAEMMGGEISLESEENKGSTFSFTACFQCDETQDSALPSNTKPFQEQQLLLLTQNISMGQAFSAHLRTLGCACVIARSEPEMRAALQEADQKSRTVTLALADASLGLDKARKAMQTLRSLPSQPRIPFGILAWPSQALDAEALRKLDFDFVVRKPMVRHAILMEILGKALEGEAEETTTMKRAQSMQPPTKKETFHARLLIAEDNIVNQKVAMGILKKLGCRVDCVANGLEAVEAVRTLPYDAVFMDCQMPEMDGYEATAAIRALDHPAAKIPVIAMTANAMKGDREKCFESGMDDYVPKPVQVQDVQEALTRQLPNQEPAKEKTEGVPKIMGEAFQPDVLLERIGGSVEGQLEILQLSLQELPAMLTSLESAVQAATWDLAARQTHSLKGTADNLGAEPFRKALLSLEKALESGSRESTKSNFETVKHLHQQLEAAIKRFLDDVPA